MKQWNKRAVEIRNLFNPGFCALVLLRALESHEEEVSGGMPFSLTLLVLPLCLHKETRELLGSSPRTHLLLAVERNPQIVVRFAERVSSLLPFTLEGLGLAMQLGCITGTAEGAITLGPKRPRKSVLGTREVQSCQRVANYVGRAFGRINDRATIYTTFGVRP
jgi:hypothetical protein